MHKTSMKAGFWPGISERWPQVNVMSKNIGDRLLIVIKIVLVVIERYWSVFKSAGCFSEVLVALYHCQPVWAEPC